MNWIFYSMLLAYLPYAALNLWGQGADRRSATENIGNSMLTDSSSGDFGSEENGARTLFLAETSHSRIKSAVGVVREPPTLMSAADELKSCVSMGPFGSVISVGEVAERLKSIGYNVELTTVDTRTGESDYRVVMPPLSSQKEAFRRHRELKSRGIKSFVITKGLDARGISLGVYSSIGPAEDYRQALIGLGYDVLLDVLPRVSRGYWVQIGRGMLPKEPLSKVAAEFIEVEVAETGCMN